MTIEIEPQPGEMGGSGKNSCRYNFMIDTASGDLVLQAVGAGAQAGQAVDITFDPQGAAEFLRIFGIVLVPYLSPG